MSFDLAVFRPARALDDTAATALYVALCDPAGSASRRDAEGALADATELAAFYAALTAVYPELDDDEDDSPFACAIEQRPRAIIMSLSFSRADEVAHVVEKLALARGLDTYDPQTSKLLRAGTPGVAPRPAGTPVLKPKDGRDRFVAGIAPKLHAFGFEPVPRETYAWTRTLATGITHQISLDIATRKVRPAVTIGHATVSRWLATTLGTRESQPTMGLEYLYFQGWIPGRPWNGVGDFEYAICHAECVATAVADFTRTISEFALPFFDALGSLPAIADFYQRPTSYAVARPNWTIVREQLSGFAGRYWNVTRGLLHGTALRVLAEPARTRLFAEAFERATLWKEREAFSTRPELLAQLRTLEAASSVAPDGEPARATKKR